MSRQKNHCQDWKAFFSLCGNYANFGLPAPQDVSTAQETSVEDQSSSQSSSEQSVDDLTPELLGSSSGPLTENTAENTSDAVNITSLEELKNFLDLTQIKEGLLKPYCLLQDYPVVDSRELMPSFDVDPYEHKELYGFAMVAFERQLSYFDEIFQYDALHYDHDNVTKDSCTANAQVILQRLQRSLHEQLRGLSQGNDLSHLSYYKDVLPFLLCMDRGHVMAKDQSGKFRLSGVNASFPSDLDTEVKRFGLRMGKFSVGDNNIYENNRSFVLQFLMELYGYPIASERRTSSALFSRRLHKLGERFMIRTLGQTDRVITSLYNFKNQSLYYPNVEKVALVALDQDQVEAMPEIAQGGYFVDKKRRVVILRVTYRQHQYSAENVRQDRALSVADQEIIHPYSGYALSGVNILKDSSNMFLRLNDIVRGEYHGRIVYKRQEVVENTDTDEKRLKFLYSWLVKHQRRFIGYSDEYFANVAKVLEGYLFSLQEPEHFDEGLFSLSKEVLARFSYIQQARKVKLLEDMKTRIYKGERVGYAKLLSEASALLHEMKFEMVNFFDQHVSSAIAIGESILNHRYLRRKYVEKRDEELSPKGLEIKKSYGRMVRLLDELSSIRKAKLEASARQRF